MLDVVVTNRRVHAAGARCKNRLFEWSVSAMMIGCGIILCVSWGSIQGTAFKIMIEAGMTQASLGPFFLTVGAARLVALWHNGGWPMIGPRIRAAGCVAGAFLWFQLWAALVASGVRTGILPIGIAVYFVLMVSEIVSCHRAALDVARN